MKNLKVLPILVLTALLVFGGMSNTAEAGAQDFTFVNYSGNTITKLYCSRSDVGIWEENILHGSKLTHGDSIKIKFNDNETGRFWDVRVVFSNGKAWEWKGVDLQEVYKMVIDGKGTAHYN